MQPLRHFVLAVQFFSRIPVTGRLAAWAGWSPQLQHASVAHLPGVGWLVGAWGAACLTATGWLLAPSKVTAGPPGAAARRLAAASPAIPEPMTAMRYMEAPFLVEQPD